jgi:hypothetical protein
VSTEAQPAQLEELVTRWRGKAAFWQERAAAGEDAWIRERARAREQALEQAAREPEAVLQGR